jgi:hypothetical protein
LVLKYCHCLPHQALDPIISTFSPTNYFLVSYFCDVEDKWHNHSLAQDID